MFGLFLLVFFLILFLAGLLAMPRPPFAQTDKQTDKVKKRENRIQTIGIISAVIILLIPILYGVGWVWYYICGGVMVIEESSFFMKILWIFLSLMIAGFLIGAIAICCGWNPDK